MGTTESSSIVNSKSSLGGLVVPAFFKSMSRFILAILVVGGSYFTVSEGLRFYREQRAAFRLAEINRALNGLEFLVGEKSIMNVKDMTRAQLEMGLYQCKEGQIASNMKLAAIEDITGAR